MHHADSELSVWREIDFLGLVDGSSRKKMLGQDMKSVQDVADFPLARSTFKCVPKGGTAVL